MKAIILLLAACALSPELSAQPVKELNEMVAAERAFIEMSRVKNRRDAFLFFLSDSAVTQGPEGPVKGKARLQQQPITDDLLDWEIAYSDMASSGDLGFNTGPWNYRSKRSDQVPVAYGEFNSVWKRQADGSWKNVLDIGISHGPPKEPTRWSSSALPLRNTGNGPGDVFQVEKGFQSSMGVNRDEAYQRYLSSEARMMVSGQLPFVGAQQRKPYLASCPTVTSFRILGGEAAQSNDLGYVYGTVTVSGNNVPEPKTATFVRIWKREASGWRIVLDVLVF
jgi:ketosteroid isomerase-like protein